MSSRGWISMFVLGVLELGLAVGCGGGANMQGSTTGGSQGVSSFVQDVQPIFNARCTSGCHSGSSPSGDLNLSPGVSYSNLVNRAVSSSCNGRVAGAQRVVPGDTNGSMLWRKVANSPDKCFDAMPFGTTGLINVARAEFDTLEKWIQEGALNN